MGLFDDADDVPIKVNRLEMKNKDMELSSTAKSGCMEWDELKIIKRCMEWQTRGRGPEESLLHIAAEQNHIKAVSKMLDDKLATVDVVTLAGRTPLHYAATNPECSKDLVEFLIKQAGANPKAKD